MCRVGGERICLKCKGERSDGDRLTLTLKAKVRIVDFVLRQ